MTLHEGTQLSDVRPTDIVVGVDGSPSSKAALRWALDQAALSGSRVLAVAAWEVPAYYGWPVVPAYDDPAVTAGKVLSQTVHEVLGDRPPQSEVLEYVTGGHPAQALIDASAHAALLVVGSRGHGGFTGTLLGSVSQRCAQHARCPVVIVRGHGGEQHEEER